MIEDIEPCPSCGLYCTAPVRIEEPKRQWLCGSCEYRFIPGETVDENMVA